MLLTRETTIGDIVAGDFRTAAVFHALGIDFCCGGRRTLAAVCEERSIDPAAVRDAILRAVSVAGAAPRYDDWPLEALVRFIVDTHHDYVKRALPSLVAHTRKLASVHGVAHPELHEVASLTQAVADEMTAHMAKEEQVLFPYIVSLAEAAREGRPAPAAPFGSLDNPIRMMEHEHEAAGAAMARIRELTGDYTPPADGCTTYRVCLRELEAFEQDLHTHVHLENNILFPRARALAVPKPA